MFVQRCLSNYHLPWSESSLVVFGVQKLILLVTLFAMNSIGDVGDGCVINKDFHFLTVSCQFLGVNLILGNSFENLRIIEFLTEALLPQHFQFALVGWFISFDLQVRLKRLFSQFMDMMSVAQNCALVSNCFSFSKFSFFALFTLCLCSTILAWFCIGSLLTFVFVFRSFMVSVICVFRIIQRKSRTVWSPSPSFF